MVNSRTRKRCGKGLLNNIINKLPIELHIPGYQYCGPGTKLQKRLARGDPGINRLDAACKEHDIAYSKNRENISARNEADRVLENQAWSRVSANDASLGEKAFALGVAGVMNVKSKLGMGLRNDQKQKKKKKTKTRRKHQVKKTRSSSNKKKKLSLRQIVNAAKASIRPGGDAIKLALMGARKAIKDAGGKNNIRSPRVLPVSPKVGGFLPFLIPLFAGLSATGALAGGAAGIANAVNTANSAKRRLEESERHNKTMEAIALGKGLYMKPYKQGLGLFLQPAQKNS